MLPSFPESGGGARVRTQTHLTCGYGDYPRLMLSDPRMMYYIWGRATDRWTQTSCRTNTLHTSDSQPWVPRSAEAIWFLLDEYVLGVDGGEASPLAMIFSTFQKALNACDTADRGRKLHESGPYYGWSHMGSLCVQV